MKKLSITEHLEEIRRRIFIVGILFLVFATAFYLTIDPLMHYITQGLQLIYVTPAELFMVQLKVAVCLAILVEIPIILWHLIAFVFEALPKRLKGKIIIMVIAGSLLFYAGAAFAYFVVTPMTMEYFLSLQQPNIIPMLSVDSYVSFLLMMVFGFGTVFLIPIPIILAIKLGFVSVQQLNKARKFIIVALAIIAAAVTPSPDAFTMMVLFIPLWLLYEISVVVGWLLTRGAHG